MPARKAKQAAPAGLKQLERTKFFAGKLLTAEDFERDQQYMLDHLRRHNRFLHGWGVVAGLQVSLEGKAGVMIAPGFAIDCAGNELVVAQPVCLKITGAAKTFFVTIKYSEKYVGQLPESGADGEVRYGRVRESVQAELLAAESTGNHRGIGPGTPGCGHAHALTLGTLSRAGSRWRLTKGGA